VHESVLLEGPFLVTLGPSKEKPRRRRVPLILVYNTELGFLFINHHLHDKHPVRREGITSFFIQKYIYLAFFSRLAGMPAIHSGSSLIDDLGGLLPGSSIGSTQ